MAPEYKTCNWHALNIQAGGYVVDALKNQKAAHAVLLVQDDLLAALCQPIKGSVLI